MRVRVCGEQHATRIGIELERLHEKLGPAHARHPFVDEKQCDRRTALLQLACGLQRQGGRPRLHHAVRVGEVVPEISFDCIQDFGLVVDRENHRFRHRRLPLRRRAAAGGWQRNPELCSARARLEFDVAAVAADQPPRDVEAEAGALPDRLGREKRIEDLFAKVRRNAGPVVDDVDDHEIEAARRRDRDFARVADGVDRVVDEIGPDLVQIAADGADRRQVRLQVDADAHRFPARLVLEKRDGIVEADVRSMYVKRLMAATRS